MHIPMLNHFLSRNKHLLIALIIGLCASSLLNAQPGDIYFQHLTYKDHLSQSTINSIIKDQVGFIWFGTEDGLNRYDGNQIRVFKHAPENPASISNSAIWSLFEDSDGTLWIGTFNGLNRYNRELETFHAFHYDPDRENSLSNNYILDIEEDNLGNLWIGTNHGLNKMTKGGEEIKRYLDVNSRETSRRHVINVLLVDHLGTLWVGTNNGLKIYNDRTDSFISYKLPQEVNDQEITSLYEDAHGHLWVGTEKNGLFVFDKQNSSFRKYPLISGQKVYNESITALGGGGNGILWVGTNSGLFRIIDEQKTIDRFTHLPSDPKSVSQNEIRYLFVELNGFVWVGTTSSGVNLINPTISGFRHMTPEHTNQLNKKGNVRAFAEDEAGEILIGVSNCGAHIINAGQDIVTPLGGEIGKRKND